MCLKLNLKQITKDGLLTLACCDLGAFNQIGKNKLSGLGINAVVIMEDRLPDFFIGYNKFEPTTDTTLNRHGPFKILSTHTHLQQLIKELQNQNIKVYLGFWGQLLISNDREETVPWLANHPELWSLHQSNNQNYDLDPLVVLQPENISFAQFVIAQFAKLKNDFNFDGLFLGDGLNGYRLFLDPTQLQNQEHTKADWTNFYQIIANGLHELNCQLLAYDCLGLAPDRAILHGADYLGQAQAGLDYLIVQTYPLAWGKKWLKAYPGFDFQSCLHNLKAIKEKLINSNCQVIYTLEMGDRIEGWQANYFSSRKQLKFFKNHANGKLLVWANELFYQMLK